ncbi:MULTISPECIES: hypothetical protein [unclassified Adlercreutzia]|uniref:hypothetical protein n=1 Tax=unclassified Adlercreutzia TaxID=2636013 RepID=UPI0013EA6D37|nr:MULTISPECIES: hypothetical protein [unclassified Adlercreutzia]
MKNLEMNYPVEGTSALRLARESAPARSARIISFPGKGDGAMLREVPAAPDHAEGAGSLAGLPFNRFTRAQVVVAFAAGILMSVVALVL